MGEPGRAGKPDSLPENVAAGSTRKADSARTRRPAALAARHRSAAASGSISAAHPAVRPAAQDDAPPLDRRSGEDSEGAGVEDGAMMQAGMGGG